MTEGGGVRNCVKFVDVLNGWSPYSFCKILLLEIIWLCYRFKIGKYSVKTPEHKNQMRTH